MSSTFLLLIDFVILSEPESFRLIFVNFIRYFVYFTNFFDWMHKIICQYQTCLEGTKGLKRTKYLIESTKYF